MHCSCVVLCFIHLFICIFLNSNIINQNLLEHMLLINLMCCVVGCCTFNPFCQTRLFWFTNFSRNVSFARHRKKTWLISIHLCYYLLHVLTALLSWGQITVVVKCLCFSVNLWSFVSLFTAVFLCAFFIFFLFFAIISVYAYSVHLFRLCIGCMTFRKFVKFR